MGKLLNKRLHSQAGLSMVGIMVAGAISIVVLTGTVSIIQNTNEALTLAEIKSTEATSFKNIHGQLIDSSTCTGTLSGLTLNSSLSEIKMIGGGSIKVGSSEPFVDNSRVSSAKIVSEDFNCGGSYPCVGKVTIALKYERRRKGKTVDGVTKYIELTAKKLTSGSDYDSCFADMGFFNI